MVGWEFLEVSVDVIKLDFNQFVSPLQQILLNYLSEGREWVV